MGRVMDLLIPPDVRTSLMCLNQLALPGLEIQSQWSRLWLSEEVRGLKTLEPSSKAGETLLHLLF